MSVRFKFRSSVNFDQVDIDGKPSISVAHLKSKILSKTHLPICHDFDLIFSDAFSGLEFRDDDFQIPSGSSVIIKRVPVGAAQSDVARIASRGNAGIKGAEMVRSSPPVKVEVVNFDDFGADLCLVPEANECESDLIVEKRTCYPNEIGNSDVPRYPNETGNSDVPRSPKTVRCQKVEASDLSEAGPRGPLDIGQEEDPTRTIPKLSVKENTKIGRVETENPQAIQNADFPSELKCPLCDTYFKEAVMIPCCQHSFCEKCIHLSLVDKGRCPKCLSTKCGVQDLLPNVSLRQAIQRFIQSQILVKSSDDAFDQYAPDGESGIQAKEVSYGVTVHKREAELPHSPTSTGKGSNHITAELVAGKSAFLGRHGSGCAVGFKRGHDEMVTDFQGENQPFQEAESTSRKKRVLWVDTTGVEKGSLESARQKRGDRACYMCGSPDHFIRDCPAASSARPMLQSGNAMYPGALPSCISPYWHGPPFYQMRPFVNPYGNPGMPPFNPTIMPATAYPVPGYMPSMYSGMPAYRRFTRMGGVAAPVGANAAGHLVGSGGGDFQGCKKREKLPNWDLHRGQIFRDDEQGYFIKRHQSNEEERSRSLKTHRDGAESVSNSDDSFTLRSHGRHRQNERYDDDPERSTSEVEDMPSSSRHYSDEKCEHHHKSSKNDGKMRQRGSDSSRSHRLHNEKKDVKRKRVVSDVRREEFKHHSQSESGLEPSFSSDHKTRKKTKDSSHGSRHSRRSSRSLNSECSRERWQMVSRSDEESEEGYHHHKRKRDY